MTGQYRYRYSSTILLLTYLLLVCGLVEVSSRSAVLNLEINPICGFIAATNIESIFTEWACDTVGQTVTNPCDDPVWVGLSCGQGPSNSSNITSIQLASIGLSGSLSSSLGALADLYSLDVSGNTLSGSLPAALGSLSLLLRLKLSNSPFTGTIPSEWGQLTSLDLMLVNDNRLTGSIPPDFGSMAQLSYLNLNTNYLSGPIPEELFALTRLRTLYLYSNSLTGSLPSSLAAWGLMELLSFNDNLFTGPMPSSIGDMTFLRNLHLNRCLYEGTFPSSLFSLTLMQHLHLAQNSFSGRIPEAIGSLERLLSLYVKANSLSGPIPATIGRLHVLTELVMNENLISGTIPSDVGALPLMVYMYMDDNRLSGSVPSSMGQLSLLQYASLEANMLTGSIPSVLGNLTFLSYLFVGDNCLSGTIPPQMGSMGKLLLLYLDYNRLTGSIPPELGAPTNLVMLAYADLSTNYLTGAVQMISLPSLNFLDLSSNELMGTVPFNISDSIGSLNLGYNELTGSIPAAFGYAAELHALTVSNTAMTGAIPDTFCQSTGISIDVGNTHIQCYSGCLTSSALVVVGASSNCHNGSIFTGFMLLVGAVVGLSVVFTALHVRRGRIVREPRQEEAAARKTDINTGGGASTGCGSATGVYQGSAVAVVGITLVKLLFAVVISMVLYSWWRLGDDSDTVLESCSNPTPGNCFSFCNDVVIKNVDIIDDDFRIDDANNAPSTTVTAHSTNEPYCIAELDGSCAYKYWMIFKLVPVLLHGLGFLLQCLTWWHHRDFNPQQRQYDVIIAQLYPTLFAARGIVSTNSIINTTSNGNGCDDEKAYSYDNRNYSLEELQALFMRLMERRSDSVFAFLEILTVVYVWGELWYPQVYCGAVRPLSLYYYPIAMTLLDLIKFNVYVSSRLFSAGAPLDALLAGLDIRMFVANFCICTVLAAMFVAGIGWSVYRRLRWGCRWIYFKLSGHAATSAAWPRPSVDLPPTPLGVGSIDNPMVLELELKDVEHIEP